MNLKIKNPGIIIMMITGALIFASCQKIITYPKYDIEAGTIFIKQSDTTDTVNYRVPPLKDTAINLTFEAAIASEPSAYDNTITFAIDTSKMSIYRSQYGKGTVLPSSFYTVGSLVSKMPAGAATSQPINIKLASTAKIALGTSYVLPIVINNVDGNTTAIRAGEVLFIVVSNLPNRLYYTVVSSTSAATGDAATNMIDGIPSTYWKSATNSTVPQSVVINMGAQYPIAGISYTDGPDYITTGNGSPKALEVDLSNDGSTWTVAGTYTGSAVGTLQTMSFATATVQYFRITVTATNTTSTSTRNKYVEMGDVNVINP